MHDTFKIYTAIEAFEKAEAESGKKRRIAGVISTESVDRQREVVLQDGLDLSYFTQKGWLNNNHSQHLLTPLGYGESVQKFKKGQTLPNGQVAATNLHWMEGYVLEGAKDADELWETLKAVQKTPRRYGFSIEGKILHRTGPQNKIIAKAAVDNVAITHCPVNTDTFLEAFVKSMTNEVIMSDNVVSEVPAEVVTKSEEMAPEMKTEEAEMDKAVDKQMVACGVEKAEEAVCKYCSGVAKSEDPNLAGHIETLKKAIDAAEDLKKSTAEAAKKSAEELVDISPYLADIQESLVGLGVKFDARDSLIEALGKSVVALASRVESLQKAAPVVVEAPKVEPVAVEAPVKLPGPVVTKPAAEKVIKKSLLSPSAMVDTICEHLSKSEVTADSLAPSGSKWSMVANKLIQTGHADPRDVEAVSTLLSK